ncbi:MAG: ArsR family transcriptional regulator [Candidatus Heimdallarchaeota archaeon]|nr:MAG: ArsR family transcriptional regulator [Candidatus Heimdallarchaeota archaeon]
MGIQEESGYYLSTRDKILQYLLQHRPSENASTIKEIADELDISINATRQYLIVLEKEGFVAKSQKKGSSGRPAMGYTITEEALSAFPKTYADFSVKLITELKDHIGVQETNEILKKVGKRIADEVRDEVEAEIKPDKDLDPLRNRLEAVTKIYLKYGKYPELVEDEDSFALKNLNCLIYEIAKADPLVCTVDETIVSELVGKKAIKEKCLRQGDECCLYRIKKSQKSKS